MDRQTADDLRAALDENVRDPRGADLRAPDDGQTWCLYFPARDAHLPWTWWITPATRSQPAQVRTWHAGSTQTPAMLRDVARISYILARWLSGEPVPAGQESLL